jgi:hypothetical protein
MEELLGFIINCVLWYLFFGFLLRIYDVWKAVKEDSPSREDVAKQVMTMIHTVKQEQHGEIFYWFDADSDAFLGQGKTDDEIKEQLKQRFKGHVFLLDDTRALAGPDLKITPIKELKLVNKSTIA